VEKKNTQKQANNNRVKKKKNFTDLLRRDVHLHQEVLDAPGRKWGVRCVAGGLEAYLSPPLRVCKGAERQEQTDSRFHAQELANSENASTIHCRNKQDGEVQDARRVWATERV